jgi:hypothetical protein
MKSEIQKYREKHKKCKWCKYYEYNTDWVGIDLYCYGVCKLKDKIINFESIPRLCKYYKLLEVKDE